MRGMRETMGGGGKCGGGQTAGRCNYTPCPLPPSFEVPPLPQAASSYDFGTSDMCPGREIVRALQRDGEQEVVALCAPRSEDAVRNRTTTTIARSKRCGQTQ